MYLKLIMILLSLGTRGRGAQAEPPSTRRAPAAGPLAAASDGAGGVSTDCPRTMQCNASQQRLGKKEPMCPFTSLLVSYYTHACAHGVPLHPRTSHACMEG